MRNAVEEMKESLLAQAEKMQAQMQAQQMQAGIGGVHNVADCTQACRDKYWSELSIEEKIERTRQMVKSLRVEVQQLYRLHDELHRLRSQFQSHRHQLDDGGKVVILLSQDLDRGGYDNPAKPAETDPDKVYF
jgi:hypothetical protein